LARDAETAAEILEVNVVRDLLEARQQLPLLVVAEQRFVTKVDVAARGARFVVVRQILEAERAVAVR
jgi:hypothetical protein